jgi:hypothetical protein
MLSAVDPVVPEKRYFDPQIFVHKPSSYWVLGSVVPKVPHVTDGKKDATKTNSNAPKSRNLVFFGIGVFIFLLNSFFFSRSGPDRYFKNKKNGNCVMLWLKNEV